MPHVQKVLFPGSQAHTLVGNIDLPDRDEPAAYALFAHCFTCSKDFKAPVHIGRTLASHGIAVLRFDFTGLGESAGEFSATTFSSNVADTAAAARYLASAYQAPALLLGHSLGGTAVLHAARQIPSAVAIVTLASPASPAHLASHFTDQRARIEATGEAEVMIAGRPLRLTKAFLDDLDASSTRTVIGELNRALLIFHSPTDDTVDIEQAAHLYEAARHPKSFISLDGADHLLSEAEDARYVGRLIATWVSRYLHRSH
jgi:putative redox protein